jgi:Integrase core domain
LHINVDIVGPLTLSGGFTHLLTVVYRYSRWLEAIPLASTTTAACAQALFSSLISRFGVPANLTSGRGPQFTAPLWASLCNLLNITHSLTPAYHPQVNSIVEKFHRHLKNALRAQDVATDWFHLLPWILLSIRTTANDDSSPSPAELVLGSQLVGPWQFGTVKEQLPVADFLKSSRAVVDSRLSEPTHHNRASTASPAIHLPTDLLHVHAMFIRQDEAKLLLTSAYAGPYTVLERWPTCFKL